MFVHGASPVPGRGKGFGVVHDVVSKDRDDMKAKIQAQEGLSAGIDCGSDNVQAKIQDKEGCMIPRAVFEFGKGVKDQKAMSEGFPGADNVKAQNQDKEGCSTTDSLHMMREIFDENSPNGIATIPAVPSLFSGPVVPQGGARLCPFTDVRVKDAKAKDNFKKFTELLGHPSVQSEPDEDSVLDVSRHGLRGRCRVFSFFLD